MSLRVATRCALAVAIFSIGARARADDKTDCIQAFDKGQALRNERKLVEAEAALLTCARDVCPSMLRKDCDEVLQRCQRDMPTLVFAAKGSTGADLLAVKVFLDGSLVAPSLDGRTIHVNPGPHTLRFETDGAPPIEQTVLAREGEKDRVVAVQFQAAPASVVSAPPTVITPTPIEHEKPAPTKSSALRWAGIATGAVGIVALGVGAGFAVAAKSKWDDAVKQCGAGCLPASPAYATRDDASTVAVIAGAVLAAGGIILFVVGLKEGRATSVALQPGAGGLWLGGTF
jgi:hypothetical protein